MTSAGNSTLRRLRFDRRAYQFVFASLRFTQEMLDRVSDGNTEHEDAHISGQELLTGIREFGRDQFGYMAKTVFNQWGLKETEDFGRIVFELIERGDMRKTEHDRLEDFVDAYDFEDAFHLDYQIDTSRAFSKRPVAR